MSKEQIVQLHKDLSNLEQMFGRLGVIEEIDSDKIRSIRDVQEILEAMLAYIKRTQS